MRLKFVKTQGILTIHQFVYVFSFLWAILWICPHVILFLVQFKPTFTLSKQLSIKWDSSNKRFVSKIFRCLCWLVSWHGHKGCWSLDCNAKTRRLVNCLLYVSLVILFSLHSIFSSFMMNYAMWCLVQMNNLLLACLLFPIVSTLSWFSKYQRRLSLFLPPKLWRL